VSAEPWGRLDAVCIVHALIADRGGDLDQTAIDKRPVDGPVRVRTLGVTGDAQVDVQHHGGPDQAIYAYAREDAAFWAEELGRAIPPGLFGENLSTHGIDVTGAVIGARWQVGQPGVGPILKVRSPRVPCRTFQAWVDQPHWIKRFTDHGAPGAYLAVETEGVVSAGDPIWVLDSPDHGVTVGEVFAGRRGDLSRLRSLVEGDGELDPKLRLEVETMLRLADA
jgi:MOSC domain-containing protein YiiM